MALNISINEEYFKSDNIEHGRLIKKFFLSLTDNVFNQSWVFYQEYKQITKESFLPLLEKERNLYSLFAAAINTITPIHLSECSFNKSEIDIDKARRVDFWCLNKNAADGKSINYFIEIKKGYYCLSNNTKEQFVSMLESNIDDLVAQVHGLKEIKPDWYGDDDVYFGLIVIHGYHAESKEAGFDERQIIDNVYSLIDGRLGAQLLMTTWTVPEELDVQWKKDKCKFVSIVGIAISKKRI